MSEMEHDFENAHRGAIISSEGKTRITIYLDDDVLAYFREVATAAGRGYQTIINATLRASMSVVPPQIVNVIDVKMTDDPRYTLTDLGRAYRAVMQQGAKLNGEVKAGEE